MLMITISNYRQSRNITIFENSNNLQEIIQNDYQSEHTSTVTTDTLEISSLEVNSQPINDYQLDDSSMSIFNYSTIEYENL